MDGRDYLDSSKLTACKVKAQREIEKLKVQIEGCRRLEVEFAEQMSLTEARDACVDIKSQENKLN